MQLWGPLLVHGTNKLKREREKEKGNGFNRKL